MDHKNDGTSKSEGNLVSSNPRYLQIITRHLIIARNIFSTDSIIAVTWIGLTSQVN